MTWARLWLALVFLSVAGMAAGQPAAGDKLLFGVTGTVNSTGVRNPHHLLGQAAVQDLLVAAAVGSLKPQEAAALLSGSDAGVEDLVAAGLVRRRADGDVTLALNFYTLEDQRLIRNVAEDASQSLAAAMLGERAAMEKALAAYELPGVDRRAVIYALVGCVILDWDGLSVTAKDGYRLEAVPQASGDRYIPWARVKGYDASVRALYWGSHNAETAGGWLTTFGDHAALPRAGLPDLVWGVNAADIDAGLPKAVRVALAQTIRDQTDRGVEPAARMMLALREGPQDKARLAAVAALTPEAAEQSLRLLLSLGYVTRSGELYAAAVPVFAAKDAAMIEALRARGRTVMRTWLKAEFPKLKARLSGLSAVRAGAPFEQVFTDVWHDLFGWTNYRLVQADWFIDPYGPASRFEGFAPFVWAGELKLSE